MTRADLDQAAQIREPDGSFALVFTRGPNGEIVMRFRGVRVWVEESKE